MDVFFPEELIYEILIRVPAKELLKFKTVCKRWRFLISEPRFADLQLRHSKQEDQIIFSWMHSTAPYKIQNTEVEYYSVSINMQENTARLQQIQVLLEDVFLFMIEYSCNGMLLLCDCVTNLLYIYNPITCVGKDLPFAPNNCCEYHWALVQDAFTRKYKVFGITELESECFVFTQGETEWRYLNPLPRTVERKTVFLGSKFVHLENKLYWISRFCAKEGDEKGKECCIYSIDVANEERVRNKIPFNVEIRNYYLLSEVKGSLYIINSSDNGLETWVLKDQAENLWIKCYSIRYSRILFEMKPHFSSLSFVLLRDIEDSTSLLDQSRYVRFGKGKLSMHDMKGKELLNTALEPRGWIQDRIHFHIDSLVNWE